MRRSIPAATIATLLLSAIPACSKKQAPDHVPPSPSAAPPAAADHSDEPEHEQLPKRVKLTPEVIRDARIRTAAVAKEALVATLSLPGEVASDPDKTGHVSSPIPGRLLRVAFQEGSS